VELEGVVEGKKEMKQISGVKGHVVGIGQHRLPQIDVRVPQRPFAAGVGVDQNLAQGVVEIQDVAEVEILRGKQDIRKEQHSE
jgi:hypothetical protein